MTSIATLPALPDTQATGNCPSCGGTFESCRCTGIAQTRTTVLAPRAGTIDDIRREDDAKGYERDETDRFNQLVRSLVIDGDRRAELGGRRARRTLAEMTPGYTRQPVLLLTRPLPVTPSGNGNQQCDQCGGWFGVTSWTCSACQNLGRVAAVPPIRTAPPAKSGLLDPDSSWACPNCGCLNADGHASCGYC
ncbi:hypothetical protein [Streptomyces sp. NPDC002785]|uniref:hypothetical protein n=1 Tax=Streptomyces sp. NPDC002785 TaxID=3154543 RepID=UPI00332DCAEB